MIFLFSIRDMLYFVLFILGLFFGSFGSVLLTRFFDIKNKSDFIKKLKWLFWGRSKCPNCKKVLNPWNLIPVISFLLQKWKCSNCKKPIWIFYPILEISSGIFFVFFAYVCTKIFSQDIEILIQTWKFWLLLASNWGLLLLAVWDKKTLFLHFFVRIISLVLSIIFAIQEFPIIQIFTSLTIFLFNFVFIYFFAKWRVRVRIWSNWEWIWQWDIWLSAIIWILSPIIFKYYWIPFSIFNLFYIFLLRITISSFLGIILFVLENLVLYTFKYKVLKQKKRTLTKNTVLPFFPSLILWFWSVLLFWKFLMIYFF